MILALFIISLLGFVYITNDIFRLGNTQFDQQIFLSIQPFVNDSNTSVLRVITFFGSQQFLVPANILLVLYFLFITKDKWHVIRVFAISLGGLALMSSLKIFFHRVRPAEPVYEAAKGFSFPSGHSMLSMICYGLMIFIVWDKMKNNTVKWLLTVILTLMITTIGFSRIYLRVHYASDVLAGFALGLVWLVIALWIIGHLEKRNTPSANIENMTS